MVLILGPETEIRLTVGLTKVLRELDMEIDILELLRYFRGGQGRIVEGRSRGVCKRTIRSSIPENVKFLEFG